MKINLSIALLSLSLLIYNVSGQSNGEVRLSVDGVASSGLTAGRLQIYFRGQWSNICSQGFGVTEANVACHQLGYDTAIGYSTSANDIFGIDDRPSFLTDLSCEENYLHLLKCTYKINGTCDHTDEVSVTCSSATIWSLRSYERATRLLEGAYPSQGRLEIYHFVTEWDTVCSHLFGQNSADTACRQLGYTHASQFNHLQDIRGTGFQSSRYYCCYLHSYDCMESCYCHDNDDNDYNSFQTQDAISLFCDHSHDVTLQCDFDVSKKEEAGNRDECDFTIRNIIIGSVIGGFFGIVIIIGIIVAIVIFSIKFCCG